MADPPAVNCRARYFVSTNGAPEREVCPETYRGFLLVLKFRGELDEATGGITFRCTLGGLQYEGFVAYELKTADN